MRKLIIIACAGLFAACACYAEPKAYVFPVSMGTNTTVTNTFSGIFGKVVEVQASCSDVVSTGTVYVSYVPVDGINSAVNIATGAVAASKMWRPTVDSTDIAGADLTSETPGCFYLASEALRVIVGGSPTNKTWKITIKVDR